MWQFAQSSAHFAASARARSRPREWPCCATLNSFVAGSRWWNESARSQRSYPHRRQRPPASSTRTRLMSRRRRATRSPLHRAQRNVPRASCRWVCRPCLAQSRRTSRSPVARAAALAARTFIRRVAKPADCNRRRAVATSTPRVPAICASVRPALVRSASCSSVCPIRTHVPPPTGQNTRPSPPPAASRSASSRPRARRRRAGARAARRDARARRRWIPRRP